MTVCVCNQTVSSSMCLAVDADFLLGSSPRLSTEASMSGLSNGLSTLRARDFRYLLEQVSAPKEVWALEAFGASHVLQEILTIKSDDTVGRSKAYEAIVKGEPMPTPGIPESLNVLLHELRGLGLSITLD